MLAAAMMATFAMSPVAAADGVSPTDLVERAAFVDCANVLDGTLRLTDAAALGRAGYDPSVSGEGGIRAASRDRAGAVRIGMNARKRGCIVEYDGTSSRVVYEALVRRFVARGFQFAGGARRPPEEGFVLDTMTGTQGPIALAILGRQTMRGAKIFTVSLFPLPKE